MTYGTNHFVSLRDAVRYYAALGYSKRDVESKVRDGEICIGPPDVSAKQRVSVIKGEGRYRVTDVD